MTKEIRMPNDARMPNDDCRKRASKASRECMQLAIRASDFVIIVVIGYFVIRHLYVGRGV